MRKPQSILHPACFLRLFGANMRFPEGCHRNFHSVPNLGGADRNRLYDFGQFFGQNFHSVPNLGGADRNRLRLCMRRISAQGLPCRGCLLAASLVTRAARFPFIQSITEHRQPRLLSITEHRTVPYLEHHGTSEQFLQAYSRSQKVGTSFSSCP